MLLFKHVCIMLIIVCLLFVSSYAYDLLMLALAVCKFNPGVPLLTRKIGEERQWDQVIFPGMKEAIVGVLLVSQDVVEERKVREGMENHCIIHSSKHACTQMCTSHCQSILCFSCLRRQWFFTKFCMTLHRINNLTEMMVFNSHSILSSILGLHGKLGSGKEYNSPNRLSGIGKW